MTISRSELDSLRLRARKAETASVKARNYYKGRPGDRVELEIHQDQLTALRQLQEGLTQYLEGLSQ